MTVNRALIWKCIYILLSNVLLFFLKKNKIFYFLNLQYFLVILKVIDYFGGNDEDDFRKNSFTLGL